MAYSDLPFVTFLEGSQLSETTVVLGARTLLGNSSCYHEEKERVIAVIIPNFMAR